MLPSAGKSGKDLINLLQDIIIPDENMMGC